VNQLSGPISDSLQKSIEGGSLLALFATIGMLKHVSICIVLEMECTNL